MRGLLWMFGIFQSYRLFDWVDERNHHVRFEVTRVGDDDAPLDPDALFPRTMRHLLLQSYLVGNIWMRMSPAQLEQVRRAPPHPSRPPLRPHRNPTRARSTRSQSSSGSPRTILS